jgi:ATP-dependent exoDNAse (exonuclease V) beta subunit
VEGGSANKELVEKIVNGFSPKYPYAGVENLPVKSSATSIMKEGNVLEEEHYPSHDLFDDAEDEAEGVELDRFEQTGKERGIAYHAFLENFDFSSLPMGAGARESLLSSVDEALFAQRESGALSPDQLALLDREKLADILSIPVFAQLKGARLYKEQQFLASLPIRDVPIMRERALNARKESFGDDGGVNIAEEELLFQGAIDLLALREDGTVWIVDYKYSRKGAESLKKKYARQLALYKKVTARILKVDEEKIRCTIVNLLRGFEVETE